MLDSERELATIRTASTLAHEGRARLEAGQAADVVAEKPQRQFFDELRLHSYCTFNECGVPMNACIRKGNGGGYGKSQESESDEETGSKEDEEAGN